MEEEKKGKGERRRKGQKLQKARSHTQGERATFA